jgi:hypothetical protein
MDVRRSKWLLPFWNILGKGTKPRENTMWLFYIFVIETVRLVVDLIG